MDLDSYHKKKTSHKKKKTKKLKIRPFEYLYTRCINARTHWYFESRAHICILIILFNSMGVIMFMQKSYVVFKLIYVQHVLNDYFCRINIIIYVMIAWRCVWWQRYVTTGLLQRACFSSEWHNDSYGIQLFSVSF